MELFKYSPIRGWLAGPLANWTSRAQATEDDNVERKEKYKIKAERELIGIYFGFEGCREAPTRSGSTNGQP